jgi:hypothetical protein
LHIGKVKVFFFEKKKQKTFMSLGRSRNFRDSDQTFFASFFQKRRPFLSHRPTPQALKTKYIFEGMIGALFDGYPALR